MENNSSNKLIIAIDGHSSCGKSTLAKALAKKLSYRYIDSGAMYRVVALHMVNKGLTAEQLQSMNKKDIQKFLDEIDISFHVNKTTGASEVYLNGNNVEREIRDMMISDVVSVVSAIIPVRHEMVRRQQALGKQKGIVMDGRDIGTVVFPHAELKIFMTAAKEVRARRRFEELTAKGYTVTMDEVFKNIEKRDYADTHRAESPLMQAPDAKVLDNSNLTIDEQKAIALKWVDEILTIKK
jgi:cytidylate kinase